MVERSENIIIFENMDNPLIVNSFLQNLYKACYKFEYKDIIVDFSEVKRIFPNVVVPISGIIDYYRIENNITFEFINTPKFLENSNITAPLEVEQNKDKLSSSPMNIVWKFSTPEDVNQLGNEFIKAVSQEIICEEGVIDALYWSINEIMDNVLQHSGRGYGFIMGQIHKQQKHIAFCVYDHGQGIYNSLKNTNHAPKSPIDAIKLAIKERVTRDKAIGQGNGMWGLSEIVGNNSGRLIIASGSGYYFRSNGDVSESNDLIYLSNEYGACSVDFQLNFSRKVSLTDALRGHKPVNYRTESFEDDLGTIVYRLADAQTGIGTRKSGEKIRNDLINLYQESKKGIIIDFENIAVISSSFADELVGKLVVHFGFFGFNQIVRLKSMNPTIQTVVERSVAQRMSESFT